MSQEHKSLEWELFQNYCRLSSLGLSASFSVGKVRGKGPSVHDNINLCSAWSLKRTNIYSISQMWVDKAYEQLLEASNSMGALLHSKLY